MTKFIFLILLYQKIIERKTEIKKKIHTDFLFLIV